MKKIFFTLLLFILSLPTFAIPLNNVDKNGNVTLPIKVYLKGAVSKEELKKSIEEVLNAIEGTVTN